MCYELGARRGSAPSSHERVYRCADMCSLYQVDSRWYVLAVRRPLSLHGKSTVEWEEIRNWGAPDPLGCVVCLGPTTPDSLTPARHPWARYA